MKQVCLISITLLWTCLALGQQTTPPVHETNNTLSLALGYGTQGLVLGADVKVSDLTVQSPLESGTFRLYGELGIKPITFDQTIYNFDHIKFPSDARLTTFSCGIGAKFREKAWSLYPYVGIRYYYVRFTDQDLVETIGTYGIVRYDEDRYGNRTQIGPVVSNAYGDGISIDVGSMLGYRLSKVLEISGLVGLSPMRFSTAKTLYGKYRGVAPHHNDFYVKIFPVRAELSLRFNF